MWSSEPIPFDAMEIALHEAYGKLSPKDERPDFKLVHEYPLWKTTHDDSYLFENKNDVRIIATKGAPEAIIACSHLSEKEKSKFSLPWKLWLRKRFRVLE